MAISLLSAPPARPHTQSLKIIEDCWYKYVYLADYCEPKKGSMYRIGESGGEGEEGLRKEFRKNRNRSIEPLFAKFSGLRPKYFKLKKYIGFSNFEHYDVQNWKNGK